MTDPVTPTEQPDVNVPADELEDVEIGAWQDDAPGEPADEPEPEL